MTINITNSSNSTTAPLFQDITETASLFQNITNSLTSNVGAVQSKISDIFNDVQASFYTSYTNSTAQHYVEALTNNSFVNGVTTRIADNSMYISGGASALGGFIAADAAVKLLRQDKGVSIRSEVTRLAIGAGLIVASETLSPNTDTSKHALSGALLNAAWKASTNPVTNHFYVLKSSN